MASRDFAIGVLSTTASVLLVGVAVLYCRPPDVRAAAMTTSGGNYVVTVGSVTQGDEDFVYVIDTSSDKMVVYRFDAARRQIELVQGIDLSEARRPQSPPDQPAPGPTRPRTRQP